jgi:hypothetical protein
MICRLFGKPGGLTRVFLDNQLNEVVDTSSLPNNGSALWAVTGLTQGVHTIKLGGLDGDGLNLLIDFFGLVSMVYFFPLIYTERLLVSTGLSLQHPLQRIRTTCLRDS